MSLTTAIDNDISFVSAKACVDVIHISLCGSTQTHKFHTGRHLSVPFPAGGKPAFFPAL